MQDLTIEKLIQSAQNQGFRFEAYSTFSDRFGEVNSMQDTYVVIEIKKHVWFTWRLSGSNDDDFSHMFFNGRYNQLNGASQKTYRIERNALKALQLI